MYREDLTYVLGNAEMLFLCKYTKLRPRLSENMGGKTLDTKMHLALPAARLRNRRGASNQEHLYRKNQTSAASD